MRLYERKIKELKKKKKFFIPVKKYGSAFIKLRVITDKDLVNKKLIATLAKWRKKYSKWFPSQFKVTIKRTKIWLDELVLKASDRILFSIEDDSGRMYGHLGFYRYVPKYNTCELDNVLRGVSKIPGLMTDCVNVLNSWGFENLDIDTIYLTVFSDNTRAISLYKRCGFVEYKKISLYKILTLDGLRWEQIPRGAKRKPQRFFLKMKLVNK